jgi:hypothetical protein
MMIAAGLLAAWIPAQAKEYEVPAKGDVGKWFAQLPDDATAVVFSSAEKYHSSGDIVLPAKKLFVVDGKGCQLTLGANSNGFTYEVGSMDEAMRRASCRYVIKDFASITGGKRAIALKATLGSIVENCGLSNQSEAAIDLRFCLLARLVSIQVTNPTTKGIVLRQGDWPGATGTNSQCNSTVLEQCRVYCAKTTTEAFTILNTNGVRMVNCVSEGSPCDHDIFLSATLQGDESRPANNPVVKSFELDNFHVEHQVRKASIYVNMPSTSTVNLNNVYWNVPMKAPVILYTMGQVNLTNLGWWNKDFWIGTRINAPRISIEGAPSGLNLGDGKGTRARIAFLRMVDPLPGNTQVQLNYVQVRRKSM